MSIFVIAETEKGARGLCAGARTLGNEVALVSLSEATRIAGIADAVYAITVPVDALVESAAATVSELIDTKAPEVVLVEPTRRMKVIAGKVASKQGVSVITDAKSIEGAAATSLFFGGIANRKTKSVGDIAIFTATPSIFGDVQPSGSDVVEEIAYIADDTVKLRSREALPPAGVDLTVAKNIIAAGRGFTDEADLQMAHDLAAKMDAEVGCTRPLTEAVNWMPRETYIGVSGLMLSPEVYVGIGVSGQMQHMVGVNTAKTIIAINKDNNAPIFEQADYGLVGDLKTVLPEIIAKL
ncbi:electron transfer flavoprotein subunit alpha/FixB family protein [Adlercreutzia sp. ZJ141]|uniref:electron transfer flavoprotein subunit alpha/FixB family protein n=1 Tax=Adlercreutzia sp. ZJ141 TaxID=2709406 RepID=UPI0013E9F47E|nr:electron transfer flavoprotein subunit alpha/FixB family protein [Adlercreutzia sp. ZJ141]